jgi:hypothetical protein
MTRILFGTVTLPHVLKVTIEKGSVTDEKVVPGRRYGHIEADRSEGRTVRLAGYIRDTLAGVQAEVAIIRGLADNLLRELDLGNGTTLWAKMVNPQFEITAEDFADMNYPTLPYSVVFLESYTTPVRSVSGSGSSTSSIGVVIT